ncbi:MOSC domain-containing protein [Aspergillus homomorphus CBS 101889]|uniref:PK beta-barrel-protein domain-containing protein-like protein n=1 Tax=Aspergillus homomorphus (strain CBS 101889) TaxID=1450537 RepID=A0A395I625_ASPHC|nr:PK beta-barrel-protein domain-containing protein-like protein [Aspergillus homomorphus CBS 101889]RAL15236.1 PK beta-barrel-protein domain-containing protein-like protein [Aspergillus homomorphus CBS 101889]
MSHFIHEPFSKASVPADDILLCVRTGKVKQLGPGSVTSAIEKLPCPGRVYVTEQGLTGDEQAYEHHGGTDKALHQYCSRHYEAWKREVPERAHLFNIGGYGENISAESFDETNTCIGDIFQIGPDGVLVQVSEPRQPCFKLNRRFEFAQASIRTQTTRRTGWYLRVLKPGFIQVGDCMRLVRRINPVWSVSKVGNFLWEDRKNVEALRVLSELPGLGEEIAQIFRKRLATREDEDMLFRLHGDASMWKESLDCGRAKMGSLIILVRVFLFVGVGFGLWTGLKDVILQLGFHAIDACGMSDEL